LNICGAVLSASLNTHILAVLRTFNFKNHCAVSFREQRVIFAAANVCSRVELSATLTNNNAARRYSLTTEALFYVPWKYTPNFEGRDYTVAGV